MTWDIAPPKIWKLKIQILRDESLVLVHDLLQGRSGDVPGVSDDEGKFYMFLPFLFFPRARRNRETMLIRRRV